MPKYIDGFVIPMPKKALPAYKKVAAKAGKIWMEYGALQYIEAVGNDLKSEMGIPFPKLAKTKPTETVVFSYIVYKSKAHRNAVNKKVMADPRISAMMEDGSAMPFDCNKMTYGGFEVLVEGK